MELIRVIYGTPFAEFVRTSSVFYPLLQILHICGIAVAAGSALTGNVRLLGAGADLPLSEISRHLYRWALAGVLLVLATGLPMALGFIDVFAANPVMWIKLPMVIAAIALNVVLARRWATAGSATCVPRASDKAMAAASISLMLGLVVLGKLLAYIGGKD